MWTGTTYALAAGMILEAFSSPSQRSGINDVTARNGDVLQDHHTVTSPIATGGQGQGQGMGAVSALKGLTMNVKLDAITPVSQQALLKMAFTTAQGIHDAVCTYRTCIFIVIQQFNLIEISISYSIYIQIFIENKFIMISYFVL